MNKDNCLEVDEIERCNDFLGVALSSGIGDDFYYFLVIFLGAFKYHERLLSTVIHEMAHVLDSATAMFSLSSRTLKRLADLSSDT